MDNQPAAALCALSTSAIFGTFILLARKGGEHAGAVSGVVIGLVCALPFLLAATAWRWEPGWWNPAALGYFIPAGRAPLSDLPEGR